MKLALVEAPSKETRKINLVTGVSKFAQKTTEKGKGLNPEQMGVWKVRRSGLSWETCLPSFQAVTAQKHRVLLLQLQVPSRMITIAACKPCCHSICPPGSRLLRLLGAQHWDSHPLQQVLEVWTSADSSVFSPRRFSRPGGDSLRLPIQQLQSPAVHATQPPLPPPWGPRPEPSRRLCSGGALEALSTGAALPSSAALSRMLASAASCTSAAERGRPAPG